MNTHFLKTEVVIDHAKLTALRGDWTIGQLAAVVGAGTSTVDTLLGEAKSGNAVTLTRVKTILDALNSPSAPDFILEIQPIRLLDFAAPPEGADGPAWVTDPLLTTVREAIKARNQHTGQSIGKLLAVRSDGSCAETAEPIYRMSKTSAIRPFSYRSPINNLLLD